MRRKPNEFDGLFEDVYLNAYPNPDRVGCPGLDALRGLASKELPIGHPAREHIARCSPCFQEFRALQRQLQQRKRAKQAWLSGGVLATAAAVIIVALAIIPRHQSRHQIATWNIQSALRDADVNGGHRLSVGRGEGIVEVNLPFGSDAGEYEIEIRRLEESPAIQRYTATATVSNGKTRLSLVADFRKLPAGMYTLAYRPDHAAWRTAPLVIN
jgi:hypothetical protein